MAVSENTQTVEDLFAIMMGEETKLAGEEDGNGTAAPAAPAAPVTPAEPGAPATPAAPADGDSKEAAELLAKVAASLKPAQIQALSAFVEDAEAGEKLAEEMKEAEEAIATGRFMARGFIEEMKLAEGGYGVADTVANFESSIGAGAANVPTPMNDIVQDGSAALSQAKKEDGAKSPSSPTTSQDVVQVVKSIVQAANVASKGQDPQEVPNNLTVTETATSGQKTAPATR